MRSVARALRITKCFTTLFRLHADTTKTSFSVSAIRLYSDRETHCHLVPSLHIVHRRPMNWGKEARKFRTLPHRVIEYLPSDRASLGEAG